MSTWHQDQVRGRKLYHPIDWTVVIDPPGQMMALYRTSTHDLAKVYMRNLKANNPGAAIHSYILKPSE